jgi:hypothetical protein
MIALILSFTIILLYINLNKTLLKTNLRELAGIGVW